MTTTNDTTETRGGNVAAPFDPSRYLRKLGGKDYLEVKWRLLWLRTEHPGATIKTTLHTLDTQNGFALFDAHVSIPGAGEATGWGSETRQDFLDFIEKAETKSLGRALAALGFGTQFCDDHDFAAGSPDNARVVDSPVERPGSTAVYNGGTGHSPAPTNGTNGTNGSGSLATPAQLKLIYMTATRDLGITEEELEERTHAQYGRLPLHLTKREASEFIDALKGATNGTSRANGR